MNCVEQLSPGTAGNGACLSVMPALAIDECNVSDQGIRRIEQEGMEERRLPGWWPPTPMNVERHVTTRIAVSEDNEIADQANMWRSWKTRDGANIGYYVHPDYHRKGVAAVLCKSTMLSHDLLVLCFAMKCANKK